MLIEQNLPIILASASEIRRKILGDAGIKFEVIKPLFDEDKEKHLFKSNSPQELATFLAQQKAISVSKIFPKSCVIGADQVCEFEGKEVFKSLNQEDAIAQLKILNGKKHFQNNCSVIALEGEIIFQTLSRVELEMRDNSTTQIERYVAIEKPWGCAGSYKYESLGKHLFAEVNGDYFAILGLNIQPLLGFLHNRNFITF